MTAIHPVLKGVALALAFASTVSAAQDTLPRQRLTPSDIEALVHSGPGTGSSGVTGIQTVVLKGDPTKPGQYTILLKVPAHTTIQAHHHPDDRVAAVTSGTWYFGYGSRFDERSLKALPPGSFYTEPPDEPHFARTGDEPVVVQISGFGPSGTHYEAPSDDPAAKH
jgi:quercetin dioxygenase-like cupin family protein